jgi:hypothetical protein
MQKLVKKTEGILGVKNDKWIKQKLHSQSQDRMLKLTSRINLVL